MVQRFLRIGDVIEATGLSKPSIYRLIKLGRFPRSRKLLGQRVAIWPENDIAAWQRAREAEDYAPPASHRTSARP